MQHHIMIKKILKLRLDSMNGINVMMSPESLEDLEEHLA